MPAASSAGGRRHESVSKSPRRGLTVYSISSMPVSGADDRRGRLHTYLITMGIRTVCFVLAGTFLLLDVRWVVWVCVLGATVLPYPAVIIANNINRRTQAMEPGAPVRRMLTTTPHGQQPEPEPTVVVGESTRERPSA